MSDRRLRLQERHGSQEPEGAARGLRLRLRAGTLAEAQVRLAAAAGLVPAQRALDLPEPPARIHSWLTALDALSPESLARVVLGVVWVALEDWVEGGAPREELAAHVQPRLALCLAAAGGGRATYQQLLLSELPPRFDPLDQITRRAFWSLCELSWRDARPDRARQFLRLAQRWLRRPWRELRPRLEAELSAWALGEPTGREQWVRADSGSDSVGAVPASAVPASAAPARAASAGADSVGSDSVGAVPASAAPASADAAGAGPVGAVPAGASPAGAATAGAAAAGAATAGAAPAGSVPRGAVPGAGPGVGLAGSAER